MGGCRVVDVGGNFSGFGRNRAIAQAVENTTGCSGHPINQLNVEERLRKLLVETGVSSLLILSGEFELVSGTTSKESATEHTTSRPLPKRQKKRVLGCHGLYEGSPGVLQEPVRGERGGSPNGVEVEVQTVQVRRLT